MAESLITATLDTRNVEALHHAGERQRVQLPLTGLRSLDARHHRGGVALRTQVRDKGEGETENRRGESETLTSIHGQHAPWTTLSSRLAGQPELYGLAVVRFRLRFAWSNRSNRSSHPSNENPCTRGPV